MNNRTLDESGLFELYVLAAKNLMSLPLEEGQQRIIDAVDLWREMCSFFPEELPPEDIDHCMARNPGYFITVVTHAGERLRAEDQIE